MAFGVTGGDGKTLIVGLRDIVSKSSDDTLACLIEVFDDIGARFAKTNSTKSKELFKAITATMSDRAACEIRFSTLLEKYINEIVPMIQSTQLSEMEEADVEAVIKLDRFFCHMHSLTHFAQTAVSCGLEAEKLICGEAGAPIHNPAFRQKNESGAARLIRELSKAVGRGGDERNGIYGKAKTHLEPILKARYAECCRYRQN